jgi:serine/threonine-protein kinase HipA
MSTQPYVDTGQIRGSQFNLAMAVGRTRHYVVDQVLPRHFVQTAMAAGIGQPVVDDVFVVELAQITPRAVADVEHGLPDGFPSQVLDQLAGGINPRLRALGVR